MLRRLKTILARSPLSDYGDWIFGHLCQSCLIEELFQVIDQAFTTDDGSQISDSDTCV